MSESRLSNSLRNGVFELISTVALIVVQFVKRTVFIQVLGTALLGINGLFSDILNMLSLADLGLGVAMAYSYYQPLAAQDTEKIAALNNLYRRIYNVIALLIAVVGAALTPFLDHLINLETPVAHLEVYYLLILAGLVVTYLFVYKSTLVIAAQKKYIVSRCRLIVNLLSLIAQIVAICVFKSYVLTLVLTIVFNLVLNVWISRKADALFPYLKNKQATVSRQEARGLFAGIRSMFVYKASSVLINSTDNLLISKIVGTLAVGFYSNYLMIINHVTNFVTMTFSALTASVGNIVAVNGHTKQYDTFVKLQVVSCWFSWVLTSSIYVVINEFIQVWLGAEFVLDQKAVMAILFNFFIACAMQPLWVFREAAGMYRKTKFVMLATALLNVALSIVLGLYFGLAGILFASALSKLLTYVWYEPIVLFRDHFGAKPTRFFLVLIGSAAMTVALIAVQTMMVDHIHIASPLGAFFVKGVLSFALANAVYFLVFFKHPQFRQILAMLWRGLRRKSH